MAVERVAGAHYGVGMRESELWRRLTEVLGEDYVRTWAVQQAVPGLDSRTVSEALADGVGAKEVWRACWSALELPDSLR